MIDRIRGYGDQPGAPVPPLSDEARDARVAALAAHQRRVMADLVKVLTPDERQRLGRLMDDRRFVKAGRDD